VNIYRLACLRLTDEMVVSLLNYARGVSTMKLEFPGLPLDAEISRIAHIDGCICIAYRHPNFAYVETESMVPKLPDPRWHSDSFKADEITRA
jgi:hypothetical protein